MDRRYSLTFSEKVGGTKQGGHQSSLRPPCFVRLKHELFSDDKLIHIAGAENDGVYNVLLAALKGLVLHLDAHRPVVADVGESGDILAPIYITQTGQLWTHKIQRIAHNSHTVETITIQFDVFDVDVEDLILELIDRLDIVNHLPDEVAGVIVDA